MSAHNNIYSYYCSKKAGIDTNSDFYSPVNTTGNKIDLVQSNLSERIFFISLSNFSFTRAAVSVTSL